MRNGEPRHVKAAKWSRQRGGSGACDTSHWLKLVDIPGPNEPLLTHVPALHARAGQRARGCQPRVHTFVFRTRRRTSRGSSPRAIQTRRLRRSSTPSTTGRAARVSRALLRIQFALGAAVLSTSPTVLLITDGLEHGDTDLLNRSRATVEIVPAAPMAESAAALFGLRAQGGGCRSAIAACGRVSSGA